MPNLHALVLAGGSGTRFWPWSRRKTPKQFLAIDGRSTLIEQTLDRLEGWVAPECRWVLTRADLVDTVSENVPSLPNSQILGEPEGRDTAPALALGAMRIAIQDPEALLLVLPSDHHIADPDAFSATVERARHALLEDDGLYTFGVNPTEPATGYGYIQRGERTVTDGCFQALAFREKPDLAVAKAYLASGDYLWNAGIFLWRASTFLSELERVATGYGEGLARLRGALESGGDPGAVAEAFRQLPKTSIDYAVLEKSDRVRVIEANFSWDDVGTWDAVPRLRADRTDAKGNILDPGTIAIETDGSVVIEAGKGPAGVGRTIVLLGMKDLLVVDTDDALLICPRDRAQEIRKVVEELGNSGREDLL